MKIKINNAPNASNTSSHILIILCANLLHFLRGKGKSKRFFLLLRSFPNMLILGLSSLLLLSCAFAPEPTPKTPQTPQTAIVPEQPDKAAPSPRASSATRISQWEPSDWSALPGWDEDSLDEVWAAWEHSCQKPTVEWLAFCEALPLQLIETEHHKRQWLQQQLNVYRIRAQDGNAQGVLTSYYEPFYAATRLPSSRFAYPLYAPPATLTPSWYSRQAIESSPEVQKALQGLAWAYLDSPVAVLNLHVQGSGRLRLTEPDGQVKTVRSAFAATNGLPFRSPLRWLVQKGLSKSASWEAAQAWVDANPERASEMLWQNPRYVFFQEKSIAIDEQSLGPVGAQGVPLSAGRSIAVDPRSIPYATPVWLVSKGRGAQLQRLVLAQDTGSAIKGAVRADYFAGSGPDAEVFARRIHQPLQLWALWPKDKALPTTTP